MSQNYVHVHSDEEYTKALEEAGEQPVIVKTSAAWCGPCRVIAPYFKSLAADFKDVTFISLDVEECEDTATELGISALPTFVALSNGEEQQRVSGADKPKLKLLVENHAVLKK
jgi:thioredoxin 1